MFQTILQNLTSCLFLLLASILIYDRWDHNNNELSLAATKKEMQDVMLSNVAYLENKINRVAEGSDSYQLNINNRLFVLEERMKILENRNKAFTGRITNINTNTLKGREQQ